MEGFFTILLALCPVEEDVDHIDGRVGGVDTRVGFLFI